MSVLSTILLILFVPVCILLILIVLLQAGKGGGLAGAFGLGGGGQTFLGARGAADFLSKLTIYLAIAFMFLALVLSLTYGTGKRGGRINLGEEQETTQGGTSAGDEGAAQGEATKDAGQTEAPSPDAGNQPSSSEGGN